MIETHLKRLPRAAGVRLLKSLGVKGSERREVPLKDRDPEGEKISEFEKLVEDVKGHALTLTLFGGFLKRAFHGDIRKRDRVNFEKADAKMDGGRAFRTMAAYEQWLLSDGGDEGRREVAVLRLMGLFDRPADADCLAALRSETVPGLTEPLAGLADDDWEYCLTGLEAAKLLTVNRDASGALVSLDAHPHLREYFARQLRTQQPDAWRAAHRRLYEHLCATTEDKDEPTLEDLQPLYQAVAHGCQAGLQRNACDHVYYARISRREEGYVVHKLGAFGAELGAIACFFEEPWSRLLPSLTEPFQAWLLNEAAYTLRALGRLTEALEPMRAGVENYLKHEEWGYAARVVSNLSELELTLGDVANAAHHAEQAVTLADSSSYDERFMQVACRINYAEALQQSGRLAEAEASFSEAEAMQAERQPESPLLYGAGGFPYCDLLLAAHERAAWAATLECGDLAPLFSLGEPSPSKARQVPPGESGNTSLYSNALRAISQRAAHTLEWVTAENWLLDVALDHLTLRRIALYTSVLESPNYLIPTAVAQITAAVDGLRRAGTQHEIPRGLLTRAWLRSLIGARTGPESAQEDLDEAWEIAERGPMRLFMADIHLYRARLFHAVKPYPWATDGDGNARGPKDDLCGGAEVD